MSEHSVVDAGNQLSELIDRALAGDDVVITRHGEPVITLTPVRKLGRPVTREMLDCIAAHRVGAADPYWNAGRLVSAMRDDEER